MLGLTRGTVAVVPHNEEWHRLFDIEKTVLIDAIGQPVVAVEHIGSTAICGLSAKPILDIMIGILPFQSDLSFVQNVQALGYEYKGENGVPERHFFGKGIPRTVHLNVVRFCGDFWLSHIAFRNHLRQNVDSAREYDQLKLSLAERFPHDRESYTNGKIKFVNKILALALSK